MTPPFINPLATGSKQPPKPASDDPFDVENRARRPVSDEARSKTIDFLQRVGREGVVRETRKFENDSIKERCYFSCSQTLQEKRAKREPDCLALCYISFKQAVDEQIAKAEEEAKTEEVFVPYWKQGQADSKPKTPAREEKYRLSALDGKYVYRARGRLAIAKHAEDKISQQEILNLEEAQRTRRLPKLTRAQIMEMMHPLAPPITSERLYPLTTAVSNRCARFETHLIRIYSPVWNAMQRLPTMWTDGTVNRTVKQLYQATINGDGLVFGQRLLDQSTLLVKKLLSGREGGGSASGSVPPSGGPTAPPAA